MVPAGLYFSEFLNQQSFRQHDVSITSFPTIIMILNFLFFSSEVFHTQSIIYRWKLLYLLHWKEAIIIYYIEYRRCSHCSCNQMVFVFVLNFWKDSFDQLETKLHPVYLSNLTLQLSPCTVSTLYYSSLKSLITNRNRLKMLDKKQSKIDFWHKTFWTLMPPIWDTFGHLSDELTWES